MSSTDSTTTTAPASGAKVPACKICCACPAERRMRDECTLLKSMDDCQKEMNAFYQCLLGEGFSEEEVGKLRRNTKTM